MLTKIRKLVKVMVLVFVLVLLMLSAIPFFWGYVYLSRFKPEVVQLFMFGYVIIVFTLIVLGILLYYSLR